MIESQYFWRGVATAGFYFFLLAALGIALIPSDFSEPLLFFAAFCLAIGVGGIALAKYLSNGGGENE
jgi:hypothetical protein